MSSGSILGGVVKRAEDPRFVKGEGLYVSDVEADGALWMVPVRSTIAHGTLESVDVTDAKEADGVVDVFVGGQLNMTPMPVGAPRLGEGFQRPAIAVEKVRFVGDIVAVVVAESRVAAVDAASLIWPDIDPLEAITDPIAAQADDAPLLYPDHGSNLIYDRGETDESVLADAEVVVEARVVNQRLAPVPLETNGALARPRPDGGVDLWAGSQSVASQRTLLSRVLKLDPDKVRVIAPDIGGGFGAKISLYPEQALCAAIAIELGRPVRWEETRTENFVAMGHGRAQTTTVRLGATREGVATGITLEVLQEAGAYPQFGGYLPAISKQMAVGPYAIPKVEFRWKSVVANTTPVHAYRGAGRPEATMALERAMDLLAAELDLDPAEVRRINFIPANAFPHTTAVRERYDSGDYEAALDLAIDVSGYRELRQEQIQRRQSNERWQMGIGLSSYVEITAGGGREDWSTVTIDPDGSVKVSSGAVSNGQSHETTFPQIVSAILKIPLESITYIQGDTDVVPHGGGTMGSRSLQIAGSAVFAAGERALHKARAIYAFHREAAFDDVVQFDDGAIGVVGVPDSAMTLSELASVAADPSNLADDMEPGLSGDGSFDQEEATFPFGTHVSVVEVDTETGDVRILEHHACDDAGLILNRMVVDGQVHGGIGQGVGQALLEAVSYADGNPQTANMTTYLIPSSSTFPAFNIAHTETPTDQNPLGVKGIGEAGTIGSTPAVVNAVIDALKPYGVNHLDMPLTPYRVWSALNS